MRRLATALAILSTLFVTMLGLSPAATHAQDSTITVGTALSNPLILTNKVTHAQVQIMPTTRWVAQHPPTGSTTGATPTPTSPNCTLAADNSPGDAAPLVNNSQTQNNALDLSSFGLSSNGTSVTSTFTVENMTDGPGGMPTVSGGGDVWILDWVYNKIDYFLYARYPASPADVGYTMSAATSNLPVSLAYGQVATGADGSPSHNLTAIAGGTFDTAHNTITITAPLSGLGSPKAGDILGGAHTTSYALAGVPVKPVGNVPSGLLETADTINSQVGDYHAGQAAPNCPAAKTAGGPAGTFPTAGSTSNLAYYGGPVVHSIANHIIWWLPQAGTTSYSNGSSCAIPGTASYSYEQPASGTATVGALPGGPDGDTDYQNIIRQYFRDLSGSSFYNLLTQYADVENASAPAVLNSETLAGEWTDHCGYTSTVTNVSANGVSATVTVPGGTQASPVYQADIQAEVARAIKVNNWPTGLGNQYYVYTGYGAADCFAPAAQQGSAVPTCSVAGPNPGYCAYHGDFMDPSGNYVLYADMDSGGFAANPSSVNLCYSSPIGVTDPTHTVNGKAVTDPIADAEVSITSHEQFETVSDAEVGTAQQLAPPLSWYDAANGEIGDKCAYIYGNYNPTDGSNITLHGNHYIVQEEYSNWNNGCALTPYQNNGGVGGISDAVSIQQGLNLISVPVSGLTDTRRLVTDMTRAGQLPVGSITQVQVYRNGKYLTYTPGKSFPISLSRTDGLLVTSKVAGTWTPTGSLYTSAPTISLHPGLNIVAATYPNPGLMTDAIYNQIEAETGACTAAILTNASCSPTITEIKAIGAGGTVIDWKPTAADQNGNATWPQTYGNQIPFTSGMEIYSTKAITWTVQGSQCNTVDATGVCH